MRIRNKMTEASDEGFGLLNSQFDQVFALTPSAEEYEGDLEKAIIDAKKGDEDAEIYLINKSKKMIFHVFWTNFIGKEASKKVIRNRLTNGEFNDFLSLVYIAFEKAIKAFKPSVYDTMKIGNFQYYLGHYLKAEAISWNTKEKDDPVNDAIYPDGMNSESESKGAGNGNAWDSMVGGADDDSLVDFFEAWNEFAESPELNEPLSTKIKTPRKAVLAQVLANEKSIPEIADELGVTKATLYSAINIGSIMKKYDIDQSTLARALSVDPDAVISPLKN